MFWCHAVLDQQKEIQVAWHANKYFLIWRKPNIYKSFIVYLHTHEWKEKKLWSLPFIRAWCAATLYASLYACMWTSCQWIILKLFMHNLFGIQYSLTKLIISHDLLHLTVTKSHSINEIQNQFLISNCCCQALVPHAFSCFQIGNLGYHQF